MTSEQLVQKLIPQPFAQNGDVIDIVVGSSPTTPSFNNGFPAAFSTPRSGGGEYIMRGMMNAIGNLASVNEYYRQAGGIYQFNPEWASLNGGYAKGAVLDYLDGNSLYKVISLVDNNKVDYTKSTLTEAQTTAGIVSGSIDGIHWAYCSVAQEVKYNEICDIPDFSWIVQDRTAVSTTDFVHDIFPIGYFKAPRNGTLAVTGSCSFTASIIDKSGATAPGGFGIAVCSYKDSNGEILNPFSHKGDYIYSRGYFEFTGTSGSSASYQDVKSFDVESGEDYQIYVVNCGGNVSNSTLKVILI